MRLSVSGKQDLGAAHWLPNAPLWMEKFPAVKKNQSEPDKTKEASRHLPILAWLYVNLSHVKLKVSKTYTAVTLFGLG